MAHLARDKKKLLLRVRKINGQVTALASSLEQDAACASVLQQTAAIRGAINGLMAELIEGHLKEHVASDATTSEECQQDVDSIIRVIRSYLK